MKRLYAIQFEGEGAELLRFKELSKNICRKLSAHVYISTCQRVEIYTDREIETPPGMRSISYPDSLRHLIELAAGVQSGLFGEWEILGQVRTALHNAQENYHLSEGLNDLFREALVISQYIREKYKLHHVWADVIVERILPHETIHIVGDGALAKSIKQNINENHLTKDISRADVIIVIKRGTHVGDMISNSQKIINLTEEKISENEISLPAFFREPSAGVMRSIREDIEKLIF